MDAYEIVSKLRAKFAPPSWAFFSEVKSAVGYSTRRADGLAVAMWRSLGLEIQGFEVKVSRSDWLNELKDGGKSDEIFQFCDRWWLVVDDAKLVLDGELPPTWGLMVANGRGFKPIVKAPKLKAAPLTKEFVAEILRHQFNTPATQKERAEYQRGYEEGKSRVESHVQTDLTAAKKLEESVKQFQEASGVNIYTWSDGKKIGEAVRMVLDGRTQHIQRDLEQLRGQAKRILEGIEANLKAAEGKLLKRQTAPPAPQRC